MERYESATEQFLDGYRCSQAVLEAYAEEFDLNPEFVRKLTLGLAGGSGVGGECGAISGGYLVISLKYGFTHTGDPENMKILMDKNKEFIKKFKSIHGEIDCPKLIGLDVFSKEGSKKFNGENIKEKICIKFVEDTIKILEKILED